MSKTTTGTSQLSLFADKDPLATPRLPKEPSKTRKFNFRVRLDALEMSPDQPRGYLDEQQLASLSESIRLHGVLQPVIVKKDSSGGFMLVAGQRRYLAARMAGLDAIPAILTKREPLEVALIENLQRCDLTAMEESDALAQLKSMKRYTLEQMSSFLGKAKPTISEIISLTRLPEAVRERCREDAAIPRSILVEIARKESEADMLLAFEAYLNGAGRKEIRNLPEKPTRPAMRTETKFLASFARRIESFDAEKLGTKQREKVRNELEKIQAAIVELLDKFRS